MTWQRFILAESIALENPWPSGHRQQFDEAQPVMINTEGEIYPLIAERWLRAEDPGLDQMGRAACVLREDGDVPARPSGMAGGLRN